MKVQPPNSLLSILKTRVFNVFLKIKKILLQILYLIIPARGGLEKEFLVFFPSGEKGFFQGTLSIVGRLSFSEKFPPLGSKFSLIQRGIGP